VIATSTRFSLFLGKTVWGSKYHDFSLLREEFNKGDVFKEHQVGVDLACIGFGKYYKTKKLHLPYKKPRKSKTKPDPKITDFQKQSNKQESQIRIAVEHAIAGMKRYKILIERFRIKSELLIITKSRHLFSPKSYHQSDTTIIEKYN
jgi:hypothetical protein